MAVPDIWKVQFNGERANTSITANGKSELGLTPSFPIFLLDSYHTGSFCAHNTEMLISAMVDRIIAPQRCPQTQNLHYMAKETLLM